MSRVHFVVVLALALLAAVAHSAPIAEEPQQQDQSSASDDGTLSAQEITAKLDELADQVHSTLLQYVDRYVDADDSLAAELLDQCTKQCDQLPQLAQRALQSFKQMPDEHKQTLKATLRRSFDELMQFGVKFMDVWAPKFDNALTDKVVSILVKQAADTTRKDLLNRIDQLDVDAAANALNDLLADKVPQMCHTHCDMAHKRVQDDFERLQSTSDEGKKALKGFPRPLVDDMFQLGRNYVHQGVNVAVDFFNNEKQQN